MAIERHLRLTFALVLSRIFYKLQYIIITLALKDKIEIVAEIALSQLKGMTPDIIRRMQEIEMTADEFFSTDIISLSDRIGLTSKTRFSESEKSECLRRAQREMAFIERHKIKVYSLLDDDYPWLLSNIPDAPKILFKIGESSLDGEHIASVVGTRRCTVYGLDFCNNFIKELGGFFPDLKVVSGLAYGIDAQAHKVSIENRLDTIAVVAHGLDIIYPNQNRDLAKRIINSGGAIVSEYLSGTTPFAGRFLERNRIVAGLSQFIMVVESEIKGGAMSTANLGNSYNRDVGALPGRISDQASSGTNYLIRKNKAALIGSAPDVIELMDWRPLNKKMRPQQRILFPELEGVPMLIHNLLKKAMEPMSVDAICREIRHNISETMAALTDLEFEGIISRRPGNRYEISC